MSYHSRRVLPPGASRKRKEREAFYASTSLKTVAPLTPVSRAVTATPLKSVEKPPLSSNQMLAGYMAYEFLKKELYLGRKSTRLEPKLRRSTPRIQRGSGKIRARSSRQQKLSRVGSRRRRGMPSWHFYLGAMVHMYRA